MSLLVAKADDKPPTPWGTIIVSIVIVLGLVVGLYFKKKSREVENAKVPVTVHPAAPPVLPPPVLKAPEPTDPIIAEFKKYSDPLKAMQYVKKVFEDSKNSKLKLHEKAPDMERVIAMARLMEEKWPNSGATIGDAWKLPSYCYDVIEDYDNARLEWVSYAKKAEKYQYDQALKRGKSEAEATKFAHDKAAETFTVRASDWMGKNPLRANEYLQEIIWRYPDCSERCDFARVIMGNNLRYIDKTKALPFYQEVANDPNASERYVRQAFTGILDIESVNNNWGNVEKAIVAFETRFTSEEDKGYAQIYRADSLQHQGFKTYAQARDAYRLFIEKNPQHPMVPRAKEELVMMDKVEEQQKQIQAQNKAEKPVAPPKE